MKNNKSKRNEEKNQHDEINFFLNHFDRSDLNIKDELQKTYSNHQLSLFNFIRDKFIIFYDSFFK